MGNASQLLASGEHAMNAEVRARHGAKLAAGARCYYSTDAGASNSVGSARDSDLPVGDR